MCLIYYSSYFMNHVLLCFLLRLSLCFSDDKYHLSYPVSQLAVLQKNLSAAHLIWQEYIKNYSMGLIALRKFIWSFTKLGDLKSAYKTVQQMVSLAISGNISTAGPVYGKLRSTRLDIPMPSNKGLGSTILDLKEYENLDSCIHPSLMYFPASTSASIEQHIICEGNGKAKSSELDGLDGQKHFLKNLLRGSFNDLIHGCAKQKNYPLASKLMLQVYIFD